MQIEIDQSIKIEQTNRDTIIAFSNSKSKTLLISAKIKKELKKIFRQQDKSRVFVYKTFAVLIYILIKQDLDKIQQIIIDKEYWDKEALIKNLLLQIIRKAGREFPKNNISFRQIGKASKAHLLAYSVYSKKAKPDIIIRLNNFLKYF